VLPPLPAIDIPQTGQRPAVRLAVVLIVLQVAGKSQCLGQLRQLLAGLVHFPPRRRRQGRWQGQRIGGHAVVPYHGCGQQHQLLAIAARGTRAGAQFAALQGTPARRTGRRCGRGRGVGIAPPSRLQLQRANLILLDGRTTVILVLLGRDSMMGPMAWRRQLMGAEQTMQVTRP